MRRLSRRLRKLEQRRAQLDRARELTDPERELLAQAFGEACDYLTEPQLDLLEEIFAYSRDHPGPDHQYISYPSPAHEECFQRVMDIAEAIAADMSELEAP